MEFRGLLRPGSWPTTSHPRTRSCAWRAHVRLAAPGAQQEAAGLAVEAPGRTVRRRLAFVWQRSNARKPLPARPELPPGGFTKRPKVSGAGGVRQAHGKSRVRIGPHFEAFPGFSLTGRTWGKTREVPIMRTNPDPRRWFTARPRESVRRLRGSEEAINRATTGRVTLCSGTPSL